MRELATIQKITNLEPILNADQLELASVLGWKCVVRKNDFKINDLVCFFEIDSFLPIEPQYEFLRKSCYKKTFDGKEGFRIKTIRLRGQISQGLILSLDILKGKRMLSDTRTEGEPNYTWREGTDITNFLGVTKWEFQIPANISGLVKGAFPSFIPKTDETRVQVLQGLLDKYAGTKCYVTEKVDGCSFTCFLRSGEFGVCSRNLELKETPDNLLWRLARELKLEEGLRTFPMELALQGELFGEGIQKNPLKIKGNKIFFFNAYNINSGKYLSWKELNNICKALNLETVKLITDEYVLEKDIPTLEKFATIKSTINPEVWAEGIVIRPLQETEDRMFLGLLNHNRVSFKSINPLYLLEND